MHMHPCFFCPSPKLSMLSSQYCSSDLQMSRLSHKLFSFGWTFKLRHLASKFCLLSDALSRIFDQEMLITRVPLNQKVNQDCDEFFKTYKDSLPKHWISGEHTMTEVLQKGQKRYSLCFNIKHNFFWHFCAYIYVRKHVSSELFDFLKID